MHTHITKNSVHTITIESCDREGRGIGMLEGIPVIVNHALPGERVAIKIIKLTRQYTVGKLLTVVNPAPERVEPFCPVFQHCGGCRLQHMRYDAQLCFKTRLVRESFRNLEACQDSVIHETIGMENPRHYRNTARYPIGYRNSIIMGFYAERSHEIVEHLECGIQSECINQVIACVRAFLADSKMSVYDEERHTGLLRHIMVRVGKQTGEIMLVPVLNGREFPQEKQFIQTLTSNFPAMKSIILNINEAHTNVILGNKNRVMFGNAVIRDVLAGRQFEISPHSFYQVNPIQTEALYRKVIEYAELTGTETVFDVYCGIGTIALALADGARQVYGVEMVEEAVNDAGRNADVNDVQNVTFLVGHAESRIAELYASGIQTDVVILDPPRKGCERRLLEILSIMPLKRLIYVSCHLKSLARDLEFLAGHGLKTIEIQPVDMFPQTTHIECVARIERRDGTI